MNRRRLAFVLSACVAIVTARGGPALRIGVIGLDTSHAMGIAQELNLPGDPGHLEGGRIVCAFPAGSPDMERSRLRLKDYTAQMRDKFGVEIVGSIAEVLARSDAIMILSLDGRIHLPQAREVFRAGKPVFIDKPFAGSLHDAVEIARLAREMKVPMFSSSMLRFSPELDRLRAPELGPLRGVIAYGPAQIDSNIPDLFYYAIHSVEAMYALMGPGCESVACLHTADTDVATGLWKGGRTAVVYGIRNGPTTFGITALGKKAARTVNESPSQSAILRQILTFFQTRKAPVSLDETVEIIAFMQAADASKHRGGAPVSIKDLMASASP